jgi:hypothetical protein
VHRRAHRCIHSHCHGKLEDGYLVEAVEEFMVAAAAIKERIP